MLVMKLLIAEGFSSFEIHWCHLQWPRRILVCEQFTHFWEGHMFVLGLRHCSTNAYLATFVHQQWYFSLCLQWLSASVLLQSSIVTLFASCHWSKWHFDLSCSLFSICDSILTSVQYGNVVFWWQKCAAVGTEHEMLIIYLYIYIYL
jgi:hypothetical protein